MVRDTVDSTTVQPLGVRPRIKPRGALIRSSKLLLGTAMALLLASGDATLTGKPVAAQIGSTTYTYTVNSTGDGTDTNPSDHQCIATTGGCTLRAAITQADSNCGVTASISTTINFAIGSGLQTIAPAPFGLPPVGCPVVIDGTTQPGYAGKPLIVLDGTATHPNASDGLGFNARCACGETVQGLVIDNWLGTGLNLAHGSPMLVRNNFIGTDSTGTVAAGNRSYGVVVSANDGSQADTIGGATAADRNVISGNGAGGVFLTGGATNNVVEGNYIGTSVTGKKAVGNGSVGVSINASGNLVGGAVQGAGNVISGNLGDGITTCCAGITNNVIEGNLVGTQAGGSGKLGNARNGINLDNSPGNTTVGGKQRSQRNVIEFNGHDGVAVNAGIGQKILGNSIFSNGMAPAGLDRIGIDLSGCGTCAGVTPNHVDCSGVGPNKFQNFPVIASATSSSTATTVKGSLNCTANTKFLVQFYSDPVCNPSGHGEGKKVLTSTTVTTVGNDANFQVTITPPVPLGAVVTSTATDPSGDTSEFSACRTVA